MLLDSNVRSEVPFRPRASKPKVRTGCIVCKIRRVKCDEAKPACLRCVSTGRKCEGYAQAVSSQGKETSEITQDNGAGLTSSRGSMLRPGLSDVPGNTSEKWSLHLFHMAADNDISRHFGDDFWARLVLQTAHAYPVVQHVVYATSALYEAYMKRSDSNLLQGTLDSPTSRAAMLRHKAVKVLSHELRMDKLPQQVVLTCCLLFVWLEFLRNDFEAAMTHLKSGLGILQDVQQQPHALVPRPGSVPTLKDVDGTISHMFTRLQIQATIHGCPGSDFNSTASTTRLETITEDAPLSFRSAAAARYCLDNIATYVFRLIRQKQQVEAAQESAATQSPIWSRLIHARDSHLAYLEQWHTTFQNSMHLSTEIEAGSPATLLLRLNYTMMVMVMSNLFSESELIYDHYNADFTQLIDLAEAIIQNSQCETFGPVVSLDMGVLPCLFYTSLKCRDTAIRHRALHLLQSAPEREGLWHRNSIIAAAAWKVAMEEKWWTMSNPEAQRLPESLRIYREKVTAAGTPTAMANVRFEGGPPGSTDVEWEVSWLLSRFGDMI